MAPLPDNLLSISLEDIKQSSFCLNVRFNRVSLNTLLQLFGFLDSLHINHFLLKAVIWTELRRHVLVFLALAEGVQVVNVVEDPQLDALNCSPGLTLLFQRVVLRQISQLPDLQFMAALVDIRHPTEANLCAVLLKLSEKMLGSHDALRVRIGNLLARVDDDVV